MPDRIGALKKENDTLKSQIQELSAELMLKKIMENRKPASEATIATNEPSGQDSDSCLEFVSNSFDDFDSFQAHAQREMRRINSRLVELTAKVDMIGNAVDDFQEYSYQYPELNSKKSASESSLLCLNLFNEIGAEVSPHDIDYDHRIPTRIANAGPRPIICKFTRRLAKENVMLRRKDACKTDPT